MIYCLIPVLSQTREVLRTRLRKILEIISEFNAGYELVERTNSEQLKKPAENTIARIN